MDYRQTPNFAERMYNPNLKIKKEEEKTME